MKNKIGIAIGVLLAVPLVIFILSGLTAMIIFITTKDYLYLDLALIYLDLALIYLVTTGTVYYLYRLSIWFESLGKRK